MENFDFTEEEIREQLEKLGYVNVSKERLELFRKDLADLVSSERSKNSSLFSNEESDSDSAHHPVYKQHVAIPSKQNAEISQEEERLQETKRGKYLQSDSASSKAISSTNNPALSVTRREITSKHNPCISEMAPEERDQSQTSMLNTTPDSDDVKVIKRRVLRKRDGRSEVCDESFTESETGNELSSMNERLRHLSMLSRPQTAPARQRTGCTVPRGHEESEAPVYRLPDDYMGPTALIRPMSVEPHKQQVKKSDPVARYQQYRQSWNRNRAPGEKQHKDLRWSMREHMLYQDDYGKKKQSKVYVPNDYVVPSEKKRKNLRWQIRNDLANGVVPPSVFN